MPQGDEDGKNTTCLAPADAVLPEAFGLVALGSLGAGGAWWRRVESPTPVTVLIQGERLSGEAVAVRDDPARRRAVFRALRPRALAWLPGVLVKVTLTGAAPERALQSR